MNLPVSVMSVPPIKKFPTFFSVTSNKSQHSAKHIEMSIFGALSLLIGSTPDHPAFSICLPLSASLMRHTKTLLLPPKQHTPNIPTYFASISNSIKPCSVDFSMENVYSLQLVHPFPNDNSLLRFFKYDRGLLKGAISQSSSNEREKGFLKNSSGTSSYLPQQLVLSAQHYHDDILVGQSFTNQSHFPTNSVALVNYKTHSITSDIEAALIHMSTLTASSLSPSSSLANSSGLVLSWINTSLSSPLLSLRETARAGLRNILEHTPSRIHVCINQCYIHPCDSPVVEAHLSVIHNLYMNMSSSYSKSRVGLEDISVLPVNRITLVVLATYLLGDLNSSTRSLAVHLLRKLLLDICGLRDLDAVKLKRDYLAEKAFTVISMFENNKTIKDERKDFRKMFLSMDQTKPTNQPFGSVGAYSCNPPFNPQTRPLFCDLVQSLALCPSSLADM
jgi:hypothetical protein